MIYDYNTLFAPAVGTHGHDRRQSLNGSSAGFGDWSVATLVYWRVVGSGGGDYHEA